MAFENVRDDWWKLTHQEVCCLCAMGYFLAHMMNPGADAQGYRERSNLDVGKMWCEMPPPVERWTKFYGFPH